MVDSQFHIKFPSYRPILGRHSKTHNHGVWGTTVGFLATNRSMGENMPSLPPSAQASAPLHNMWCVFTEPFVARPTISMPTRARWVIQRPAGVLLKLVKLQFVLLSSDHQGICDFKAQSSASWTSNPTLRRVDTISAAVRSSGSASPSCEWNKRAMLRTFQVCGNNYGKCTFIYGY